MHREDGKIFVVTLTGHWSEIQSTDGETDGETDSVKWYGGNNWVSRVKGHKYILQQETPR